MATTPRSDRGTRSAGLEGYFRISERTSARLRVRNASHSRPIAAQIRDTVDFETVACDPNA